MSIAQDVGRIGQGMPGFTQRLKVAKDAQAVRGDEDLVVRAAAEGRHEEVPHRFDSVPDLILGRKPEELHQLGHGMHRIRLL